MRIGDEEITRDQMPAMQAWFANPSHTEQGIQDVLNSRLGRGLVMPQTQDNGQMQTSEGGSNQWQM